MKITIKLVDILCKRRTFAEKPLWENESQLTMSKSLKRKNNYKNNETSEDKFGSFYHVIQKIRNRNKDYNELKKVEKIILYFRNKEF